MWLEPQRAHLLKGGKKNGFLVSANPGNHAIHTEQLRTRMPVAEKLAAATDAAAAEAGLSNFDLARGAVVARGQGLDPRDFLSSALDDKMVRAIEKFRDGVFDAAKSLKAAGCMGSTTPGTRPLKRPRRDAPSRSSSPPPRAAPTAGGLSKKAHKPGRAEQKGMTSWGQNASLAVQNAHLQLQDDEEEG